MKTYYILLKAVDNTFGECEEYEFTDEFYGTVEDLSEALNSWKKDKSVTVVGVTE